MKTVTRRQRYATQKRTTPAAAKSWLISSTRAASTWASVATNSGASQSVSNNWRLPAASSVSQMTVGKLPCWRNLFSVCQQALLSKLSVRAAPGIGLYCEANFRNSPVLQQLIESRTARSLKLTNRIDITVRAADFRNLRGPTYIAIIADEAAFWYSDNSANPNFRNSGGSTPGLATTGGPLFLISSPYARRGELWRLYDRYYGKADDPLILVAQGASRTFNPSLPQSVVDRAMERDPSSAAAEYLAEFRTDLEAFVSIEAVRACVSTGTYERAPIPGTTYHAFVDPAGGSGSDTMTLAIGHIDHSRQIVILDAIREQRPPFSPEQVTQDFATLLRSYNIVKIIGDKYAGGFPPEQFGKFNILYDQSAKPKSDLYTDLLPHINSCRIQLLDHPRLITQLTALERRSARGGRNSIDHPPNAHDDLANAVAGLASINTLLPAYDNSYQGWADDPTIDREVQAARYQRQKLANCIYSLSGGRLWPR